MPVLTPCSHVLCLPEPGPTQGKINPSVNLVLTFPRASGNSRTTVNPSCASSVDPSPFPVF